MSGPYSPASAHKGKKQGKYTAEQIDRALCAAAYWNGNAARASESLKGQGLTVPARTLTGWVSKIHADRYAELRRELLPKIHEAVAQKHRELAEEQMEASREFLQRLRKERDNLDPRDLSTAQRNLQVGAGISTDKSLALTANSPGTTALVPNFQETIAALAAKNIRIEVQLSDDEKPKPKAIESTATEVDDES